ncbi:hypothetical protein DFJ73DRAFT_504473 [Zopfochytrium polystomum]|nr:hypothetical protein DFJ73DRAFT_504473 [Zopfochytrium polystomum]
MSTSSAKGKVRLFEDSDDAVDSSIGSDRGYSKATLSTIRLLQDTLKTEDAPPASFHTLTKDARRSDKVRLFFELLVLKTKDMIGVQQDEPFKDVLISGKASLFAAGAAS